MSDLSDIIQGPIYIESSVSEAGLCIRPQVKGLLR
jgi:hypothetical protein